MIIEAGRQTLGVNGASGTIPVDEGRQRIIVDGVTPELEAGRFPIKRVVGEEVVVEANVYTDGHDSLSCVIRYRHVDEGWLEVPLEHIGNDRWRGAFLVTRMGSYRYTVTGWVDHFKTWRADLAKRVAAGQDVSVDLQIGAGLVLEAAERAEEADRVLLSAWAERLVGAEPMILRAELAQSDDLHALMQRNPDRRFAVSYARELHVWVDRERARFSTWYELFPRSCADTPDRHGTFADVERRLPYIADMGFDVVYLPPIHPIGYTFRKGKNNTVIASPGDVGSPWAIGATTGGHTDILAELGTLDDFRRLVQRAHEYGMEIAMDIAFQCSPDHPYVKEHPSWFKARPDGTIQYAENPPKKYQDIYPFDFESTDWRGLWRELCNVMLFWCEQGVRIFRVDNPHTKAFRFWEWAIAEIKKQYPETIFLAEAFTRPKVMQHLAKLGFTQSYTYFAWRNTKWELTQYFTELTHTDMQEYYRPNVWPNTPDILTEYMQIGGRPAFMSRIVLAATLAATYGIYGPAYELCENRPAIPGKEEYLDSEKYQIRLWDLNRPDSLSWLIKRLNAARRQFLPLQTNANLRFHQTDNEQIICYSKSSADLSQVIITIVNLDYMWRQTGWVELPLEELDLDPSQPYQVYDLLTDATYTWNGRWNYVELDPQHLPAHVLVLRRP